MRIAISAAVFALFLLSAAPQASADANEDLRFAEGLLKRKWYDWAEEVAVKLVESKDTPHEIKGWAAELHVTILDTLTKQTGEESYRKKADELRKKYRQQFDSTPAWGHLTGPGKSRLYRAEELARKAQSEPDTQTRIRLIRKAREEFKQLDKDWQKLVKELREEVAKYPPNWDNLKKQLTKEGWEKFLDAVWNRDLAEYMHATMFISWAKVVSEEKKREILQRSLGKFNRFIDGEKEHEKDFDPPAKGEKGPQEPSSRTWFNMLLYKAEIGKGRCHLGLAEYDKAVESFDWMTEAELPSGLGRSEVDIKRIVDIRLEAYYLEAHALNLAKKYKDTVTILTDPAVGMFALSGKPVQPNRPGILAFWKQQNRPEVALMPKVVETLHGKLAVFELAKALAALKRYREAIKEVYGLLEAQRRAEGEKAPSPVRLEAAKTLAGLVEKYLTSLPPPLSRTKEQNQQAAEAKLKLAQAHYENGDYEKAAKLFDELRRLARCPVCGHEKVLTLEEFDKPPEDCPKCRKEGVKLRKVYAESLPVQDGAAKSYLKLYEKDNKRKGALDKAQDIFQRMYGQCVKSEDAKCWEAAYYIIKIWFYKRDYKRIIGDVKNLILLTGGDPDDLLEGHWKDAFPVQPWRDRIRDLFEEALEETK